MTPDTLAAQATGASPWLVEWLVDSFQTAEKRGSRKRLDRFLDFCRKVLAENPPVQFQYLPTGLGVQLRDGTHLSLAPCDRKMQDGRLDLAPAFNFFGPASPEPRLDVAPYQHITRQPPVPGPSHG